MKLKDARDNYYFYSGKTSDIVRQLGFAGVALVWLYRFDQGGITKLPTDLRWPLILIVLGLALDLLHYATGTAIWGPYHRLKEKSRISPDAEFEASPIINLPTLILFAGKIISVGGAYVLLLRYIYKTVF